MKKNITLDSPIFEGFKRDFNAALLKVLYEVWSDDFESGEVSCKLRIEFLEKEEEFPCADDEEPLVYPYKTPIFDYQVQTNLNKKTSVKGVIQEPKSEVLEVDGSFSLNPVIMPQMDFLEE